MEEEGEEEGGGEEERRGEEEFRVNLTTSNRRWGKKANHRSKPPDSPEEANGSLSTCIEGLTGQSVSHSS